MAAMTTALTQFSTLGDSRTWTLSGHTVQSPRVVVQKRKVPVGNAVMSENSISVVYATKDANNVPLAQKINFTVTVRYPVNGLAADVDAAQAIIRDIVAGDEFASSVDTQGFIKP